MRHTVGTEAVDPAPPAAPPLAPGGVGVGALAWGLALGFLAFALEGGFWTAPVDDVGLLEVVYR